MATIMKRQKDPLAYLEQVRQHMSRLPSIDPTTRTLLVCGYPNVGKSSFVNKVTRADVDVQPYAFTTKSLFVGHLDYKYLRWQVIDTPGVLDHPLEEMNTIEMQSITALAHLRSAIMYFMDLSEECGYSLEAQAKLFHSIKPLFAGKPTFIVINKIDVVRPEDLDADRRAILDSLTSDGDVTILQLSCHSEEGVMDVKNAACEALLAHRVESKEKTKRVENVANRIRVAVPMARDEVERLPFIPPGVAARKKYDATDPGRKRLERDIEAEHGGAGVYSSDLKKDYDLKDPSWNHDVMPEMVNGRNFADFIDPDIAARLEELEAEEDRLEAEGFYEDDDELVDSDEEAIRETAEEIRDKRATIRAISQVKKAKKQNVAPLPRSKQPPKTIGEVATSLRAVGLDPSRLEARAAVAIQAQKLAGAKRKRSADDDGMDIDGEEAWEDEDGGMDVDDAPPSKKSKSIVPRGKRVPVKNRAMAGLRDEGVRSPFTFEVSFVWLTPRTASATVDQAASPLSPRTESTRQSGRSRPLCSDQDAQAHVQRQAQGRKDDQALDLSHCTILLLAFYFTVSSSTVT